MSHYRIPTKPGRPKEHLPTRGIDYVVTQSMPRNASAKNIRRVPPILGTRNALANYCRRWGWKRRMAVVLGVDLSLVSRWCSGQRPINMAWCLKIQHVTGGEVRARVLRPDLDFTGKAPRHSTGEKGTTAALSQLQWGKSVVSMQRDFEASHRGPTGPATFALRKSYNLQKNREAVARRKAARDAAQDAPVEGC